jgi:hypothetical protein
MRLPIIFLFFATSIQAAIEVPSDLRNPFEKVDPTGFRNTKFAIEASDGKATPEMLARGNAFNAVFNKLKRLAIRGVIENKVDPDNSTVLMDRYVVKRDISLNSADFDFSGVIKVVSANPSRVVFSVAIDLETRELVIPIK